MKLTYKLALASVATMTLIGSMLPALAADVTLSDASSPKTALNAAVMKVEFPAQTGAVGYSILATSSEAASQRGSTAVCGASTCASYLTALSGGANYSVEVRWINSAGVSTVIGESSKRAVSIPGSPTAISANATGTSVALAWALPSNSGGLPLTSCSITGGPSDVSVSGTSSSKTIDNLVPGIEYALSIACKNDNGTSASSSFTAFTVKTAPTAPAKPTATRAGDSVTVGWVAPASNGADITGYSVYLVDANGSDVGTATSAAAGATSAIVSVASAAAGSYTVQVVATNAIGSSARSPKSTAFTVGAVEPSPSASPSASPSLSPSATPSASPTFGGGGGGGGGGGPAPTPTSTASPSAPPVVIAPKPTTSPTPIKTVAPSPAVVVKAVPGLAAGSTTISKTTLASLTASAKSIISGKAKQVSIAIATKGTTIAKAKAQAAAVAKALANAGVTATVKVSGTGSKTAFTVVAVKKKK